jgi:dipeptidase E
MVQETDVLLVDGGDSLYLCHWMRQSGLADLFAVAARDGLGGTERREHGDDPQHRGGRRHLETAHRWRQSAGNRRLLDLSAPDHEALPENTMADAERWAAGLSRPAYAIDDETAIKVVDGSVEVVSEGHWKLFTQ